MSGQVVVGLSPEPGQEAYPLGGEGLKVSTPTRVAGRAKGPDVLAAAGRARLLHEQGPDLLELEVAEGMSVQGFQTNTKPSATLEGRSEEVGFLVDLGGPVTFSNEDEKARGLCQGSSARPLSMRAAR